MNLGLYVPVSIFVILWLASLLKEVRYQLDRSRHERDVYACTLDVLMPGESQAADEWSAR
jgi:hypothetical protein